MHQAPVLSLGYALINAVRDKFLSRSSPSRPGFDQARSCVRALHNLAYRMHIRFVRQLLLGKEDRPLPKDWEPAPSSGVEVSEQTADRARGYNSSRLRRSKITTTSRSIPCYLCLALVTQRFRTIDERRIAFFRKLICMRRSLARTEARK